MENMKAYQAMYCPCTEESAYGVISTHLSYEGALNAVQAHKDKEYSRYLEHKEILEKDDNPYIIEFAKFEDWVVNEIELLD